MTRRIWITETEKQKSIRKTTKKQKKYKPISFTNKKEVFTKPQYFCPECGINTYDPGTINPDIGVVYHGTHYTDGAGTLRCSVCNNMVLRR